MKTEFFKHPWPVVAHQRRSGGLCATVLVVSLLIAGKLMAVPAVQTVSGGPSYGYVNGDTKNLALFHTPIGLALGSSPENLPVLYVADRDNNAIRKLDLAGNQTITFLPNDIVPAGLISKPVGVAVDAAANLYVLNRGNGSNGTVLEFDAYGNPIATNAVGLINANAIAIDYLTNIYVTVEDNKVRRITPSGANTIVATITEVGALLQGITVMGGGILAVSDSGRNGILIVNPNAGTYTNRTGFNGAGDHLGTKAFAKFNQPYGIAAANGGYLVVTDYGNQRVKVVDPFGTVSVLYGVCSNNWVTGPGTYPGWWDGNGCSSETTCQICDNYAEARLPAGVIVTDAGVYTTEDYYHLIRLTTGSTNLSPVAVPPVAPTILTVTTNYGQVTLTWSAVAGATNYIVRRAPSSGGPYTIIATTAATSYTDTSVVNGTTYYYVVSASNAGGEGPYSVEVIATPPLPPVPDPQIGYVDFPATSTPVVYTSVFHPVSSYDFYNDATIVIKGTPGSGTYYTYGTSTTTTPLVPDPTLASASVPSDYQDGLLRSQVSPYIISQVAPYLIIKAMGAKGDGSPNSAVVTATFHFITGNPVINGNNAAHFTISDITANAHLYYTLDGSDPSSTNYAPNGDLGMVASPTNVWSVGFPIQTNTLFKVRAFHDNYQPSAVVSFMFSATNFAANTIGFGRTSGELSSKFLARPGQFFYAPVTLNVLPGIQMYSLQFNAAVTNGLTSPSIQPGAGIDFFSMLMSQVLPDVGNHYPPNSGQWYLTIPPFLMASVSNQIGSSLFVNTNNNLLGVGWLYRQGYRYTVTSNSVYLLDFDTKAQDLISYSIAHDTLFDKAGGVVVVGAYSFQVPATANTGDKYYIQLGSPSATSDGIGAPGSDIYIQPPPNNTAVTVTNTSYLVGDAAPFRWLNAGDFGNGNLLNDDVMQVFQSAILGDDMPPANSDLYLAMDSCGNFATNNGAGIYIQSTFYTNGLVEDGSLSNIFGGSSLTINDVVFGDGQLDVGDVFVTFRRSLDPSLKWFVRFWNSNQFVAVETPNLAFNSNTPSMLLAAGDSKLASKTVSGATTYQDSTVSFTAGDAVVSAGQTVQIPINASIFGNYPLRVLGLNITVRPLDGSPDLTQPVQFSPAAGLGMPTIPASKNAANYSAAWLDSTIAGLSGNASLGTLSVTLPASATASSAYAIHFDHASGSPNGLATFPKHTLTGLITLSDRSASSWGDGIPDSWRLRYFGTIHNLLSAASADADGDGSTNWQEYKADTDPNDAASVLRLRSDRGQVQDFVIHWPSVANKQYVVERSPSFTVPSWTAISTNAGTGGDIEFHDNANGPVTRFYRVRLQE